MTPPPQERDPAAAFHCEVWAGTRTAPYRWLLRREAAPVPVVAIRRLRAAAWWLADLLDDDPDDPRIAPSTALRLWLGDSLGHEAGSAQLAAELADRLAAGAYLAEAVTVMGPDHVRYTLTAMPQAGCVCGRSHPTVPQAEQLVAGDPVLAGGWAR
ncbi:hypothetical protein ACFT25_05855 [Streptomyces hydrogenans]|uniref:hypothetical protein n=1 Tax=Streptomyces hydrogenans TaxID=1873719 RepID=UPI0036272E2F